MVSLDNVSSRTDFTKSTYVEIEARQLALAEIIEEARDRGQPIDSTYLKYQMKLRGFLTYNRNKLYQDRLALDSKNNYIRDFLPRYSQYQEDIANILDFVQREAMAMHEERWEITKRSVKETKDGTFTTITSEDNGLKAKAIALNILNKTAELKQKHCEGQNIQISAVIIQKELATKKAQIIKLQNDNRKLTLMVSKAEAEKK